MPKPAEHEHSGHRDRVRKKFIDNGFDGFEPHEVLEMYLFYAIPRKDTNPLAHKLLNRYITISGVCDAPLDELMNDFSLSRSAAVFLKMLPQMSRLYIQSKTSNDNVIDYEHMGECFVNMFIGRTEECVALILGDAKGKLLFSDIIIKGALSSTSAPTRKIVDIALRHNAKCAFLAHNHPSGSALPSSADITATRLIKETLLSVGIDLVDHFIVTTDDYVSLAQSELCGGIFCYED